MSGHTPGPLVVGWGGGLTGPTTVAIGGPTVAGRKWGFALVSRLDATIGIFPAQDDGAHTPNMDVANANAALFAAAPQMLAELKHLVRLLEPMESDGTLHVPGLATMNHARNVIAKAEGRQ